MKTDLMSIVHRMARILSFTDTENIPPDQIQKVVLEKNSLIHGDQTTMTRSNVMHT